MEITATNPLQVIVFMPIDSVATAFGSGVTDFAPSGGTIFAVVKAFLTSLAELPGGASASNPTDNDLKKKQRKHSAII